MKHQASAFNTRGGQGLLKLFSLNIWDNSETPRQCGKLSSRPGAAPRGQSSRRPISTLKALECTTIIRDKRNALDQALALSPREVALARRWLSRILALCNNNGASVVVASFGYE